MGTRSLTHVKDETGKTLVTFYRQYDGYPTGMGADIKRLLSGRTLVNGISGSRLTVFNGIECAAAYLIGALKGSEAGNVYVYPPDSSDCGEEYVYTLSAPDEKNFHLEVKNPRAVIYSGPLVDFDPKAVAATENA